MLTLIPEVKNKIKPLTRSEIDQIQLIGEAMNIDMYKSRYDLTINSRDCEFEQFNENGYQVGKSLLPIYMKKQHGSLN